MLLMTLGSTLRPPAGAAGRPRGQASLAARGGSRLCRSYGRLALRRAAGFAARDGKAANNATEQPSSGGGSSGGSGDRRGGSGGSGGDGSGGGGPGGDGERATRRALALAALKWTAAAAAGAAALLAAAPYALSNPLVLRLALATLNIFAPTDVWLDLDQLEAGWQRPLQLHNLRLIVRSGGGGGGGGGDGSGSDDGGAPFDPSSSDEEDDHPVVASPAGDASHAAQGGEVGAGLFRRRRRRRRASGAPGSGGDGAAAGTPRRRRTLISVERVRTPQTLLQLLRGGRVEVIVSRPQIDCTLNAEGTPRLLAVLQQAGLVPAPHPAPKQSAVAAAAAPSTAALGGGAAAAAGRAPPAGGGSGSRAGGGAGAAASPPAVVQLAAPGAAGGGASSAPAGHDSDSDHEEHPLPSLAEAAAAAAAVAAAAKGRRKDGGARGGNGEGGSSAAASGGSAAGRPPDAAAGQPARRLQQQQQQQPPASSQQQQQQPEGQPRRLGPAAAAQKRMAALRTALPRLPDDSSDSEDEQAAVVAAAAAKRRPAGSSVQSVSPAALLGYMMPARAAQQAAKRAAPASSSGGGGGGGGSAGGGASKGGPGAPGGDRQAKGWLPESLQQASATVDLSGELRVAAASVFLSDGALLVPAELRELLGSRVHFEVLRGLAAIEEAAAEERPAAAATAAPGKGGGAASSSSSKELKWARQRPAVLLPWGTGAPQAPVSVRLDSPTMRFSLQGWQTARGFTYLRRPLEASMKLTPALGRYFFKYLHPALSDAVGLRAATELKAQLMPHDGLWPTSKATLRVEPVSLEVGESPVLRQALELLSLADGKVRVGGGVRAELSRLQATLSSDGELSAERLDIRVGVPPWRGGLRLVSWGSASLRPPQQLDATLCVPGDALSALGLPPLPQGHGLAVHLGGTPSQPRLDVVGASRQLAALVAHGHAARLAERGRKAGLSQWVVDQLDSGLERAAPEGIPMPPPLE